MAAVPVSHRDPQMGVRMTVPLECSVSQKEQRGFCQQCGVNHRLEQL